MIIADINQSALQGGQRIPSGVVKKVLSGISRELGVKDQKKVSIGFVSKAQIRALNKKYRGKDKATDVLSFQVSDGKMLGEVLICYEQAKKQAAEMKHTARKEIQFLLVHGILHLFDFDHEKPAQAKRMFSLQEKILTSLRINPEL